MTFKTFTRLFIVSLPLLLIACEQAGTPAVTQTADDGMLTAADAVEFVDRSEQQLAELGQEAERMAWVYSTYITDDTEQLSASASKNFTARQVELAGEASSFNDVEGIDSVTRRKLDMLRSGIVIPAPSDADKTEEQANIGAKLGGMYSKGEYCYASGECLDLGHLSDVMAESRDPDALLEAWDGWRKVSPR